MRKSRKNRNNPKKDKRRLKVSKYTRFTSEVQLQGLQTELKRTKLHVVSNETELSNLEDGSVENARDICAHIEQD